MFISFFILTRRVKNSIIIKNGKEDAYMISKENLTALIKTNIGNITVLDTVDSTNSYAKRQITSSDPLPSVIIANEQAAGRGRLSRSFFSPRDTGLYMTILCRSDLSPEDMPLATVVASVASARAIEDTGDKQVQIKWVNDLYIDGKKAGGILCESVFADGKAFLIIGIGINVTTPDFPVFDNNVPTSTGELDKELLAARIYDNFMLYMQSRDLAPCLAEYEKRFYLKGKAITILGPDGSTERGVARSIDARGGLVVELEDGKTKTLRSGEVTVR